MSTESRANPNRLGALYGAAARRHLVLTSTFQPLSQKNLPAVTEDAKALDANFTEFNEASAEYSMAAIILFISWCNLVSSGGSRSWSCLNQISDALFKKDVAVAIQIAQAIAW